jgi:hypothetical protein
VGTAAGLIPWPSVKSRSRCPYTIGAALVYECESQEIELLVLEILEVGKGERFTSTGSMLVNFSSSSVAASLLELDISKLHTSRFLKPGSLPTIERNILSNRLEMPAALLRMPKR